MKGNFIASGNHLLFEFLDMAKVVSYLVVIRASETYIPKQGFQTAQKCQNIFLNCCSITGVSGGVYKTLAQIKDENLGMGDKVVKLFKGSTSCT